jgi:tetratricopeptide (TPR) repeat protein
MTKLDFPPARFEVEDQLKRMLAAPRFKNATNPSDFLKLGVERALKGQKTTGSVIAKGLFEGKYYSGLSSDVRVTAKNLRRTLAGYYANEGENDVVIISYPTPSKDKSLKLQEGKAYTPTFSYNPKHERYILIRMGFQCLDRSTYRDYRLAFTLFSNIFEEDRNNIGAIFGLIEAICKFADRHWKYPVELKSAYAGCINLFDGLQDRAQNYWRFWATKAYLHKGMGKNHLVASLYAKALEIDRTATESYLPYIEFLFDSGKREEALGLAQRYVNDRVEDANAVAQYGQILCGAGLKDIGIGHLKVALMMDPGNCLAHETLAAVRFAERDVEGIRLHLRMLRVLCDDESFRLIVEFLESEEDRYDLKGCVAGLLSQETSGAFASIVKP